jgi:hypothetical protein
MLKRLRKGSMDAQGKAGTPLTAVTIGRRKEVARPRNEVAWLS